MYKQTINNISLQLVMQLAEVMNYPSSNHTEVLSRDDDGFRFEEAVKYKFPYRNPKMHEDDYVNLIHRSDGTSCAGYRQCYQAGTSAGRRCECFGTGQAGRDA